MLPILYSFRRCPYAIRSRMALLYANRNVRVREVVLKHKPAELLETSAKGTVPVLVLPNGQVIDESLDIMHWALTHADPQHWLKSTRSDLIEQNDRIFKPLLDGYKYPERSSINDPDYYRNHAMLILKQLEDILQRQPFLSGTTPSLTDIAVFPFIRQFSMVDESWFAQCGLPELQQWCHSWLKHPLFVNAMTKYDPWTGGPEPLLISQS